MSLTCEEIAALAGPTMPSAAELRSVEEHIRLIELAAPLVRSWCDSLPVEIKKGWRIALLRGIADLIEKAERDAVEATASSSRPAR